MKKTLLITVLALALSPITALAQQAFSQPEQAINALQRAVSQQDEKALANLLGDNWRDYFPDHTVDPDAVARFLRDWQVSHHIDNQGNVAWLDVGREAWRLPIPLVKNTRGWSFDMQQAAEEIQTRTIGRNELAAIQAMHAYVAAQQQYYGINQQWAHRIISSEGKKDGLYWPATPGEAPSPLGPAFSPVAPEEGYHGYHFHMIGNPGSQGPALIAWPVAYGETGIMSFTVTLDDKVYQANLGEETANRAQAITAFRVQSPWKAVIQ